MKTQKLLGGEQNDKNSVYLFMLEVSTLQVSLLTGGQDCSVRHDLEFGCHPWTGP